MDEKEAKERKNYYEKIWDVSPDYIKNSNKTQAYRKIEPDTEVKRFFEWVRKRKKEGTRP